MKNYTTDKIRNVAILGHGGCGKSSLVEAMAFVSGLKSRMEGTSLSDYDKEEQKRKFSISTSIIPIEWKNCKINILDTPGFFDFVGEVEEAISVADAAIIVVSGKAGVEVGAEKAWALCEKHKIPHMIYVSNMDAEHTDYQGIIDTLSDKYSKTIVPFYLPILSGDKFAGHVNVVKQNAEMFADGGKVNACDVPAGASGDMESYRESIMEAVAETSEDFMERYFGGDEFTDEEINAALQEAVSGDDIIPVCLGSSTNAQGIAALLDDIVNYFPAPSMRSVEGKSLKSGDAFKACCDASKAKCSYVFKTIVDPFIGKYSLVKVMSGVLKGDDILYNSDKDVEEKPGKVYVLQGSNAIEVPELQAGDIGAMQKLTVTTTGDTLSTKAEPIELPRAEISVPYTYMRYEAKNKGEEDKIAQAIAKIAQEDMTIKSVVDPDTRQSLIYGIGDQQLDVVVSKLLSRYKAEIILSTPKVAFRETIRGNSDIDEKYKKQSGGHGQYGHVKMRFEPSGDMEKAYIFEECVVGGAVPKNYFPAVEKGLQDAVIEGPVAGYPVVGVKATLYDGSYHPVDSSEMAFKTATRQAFKKGFMAANPILLEPIASVKVTVPDAYTGDVMGDLNKRRGRVLGMNPISGGLQVVEADVPMTGMFGYCTTLRAMTGGRGIYEYSFARYEQAPSDVQEKEIAARAAEEEN